MRIALVVHRYGAEIVGGSESLARQYAHALADLGTVEVLTTCALDHITWRNHYPPGVSADGEVTIRRFPVDFERGPYWLQLDRLMTGPLDVTAFARYPHLKQQHAGRMADFPRALQEETLRWQGPYSSALFDHLASRKTTYDVFLFITYLYPTTYFGMQLVPGERAVFCPTLHDEPMAYLPVLKRVFRRPRFTIFLSEAERALAERLYGRIGTGGVVGMAIPDGPVAGAVPEGTPEDYVLHAGRLEGLKGVGELVELFTAFKQRHPSPLKLVLIGKEVIPIRRHPDIIYLGFVSEAQKGALMKGAKAFLHPSPFESFSIVLLESFRAGTPALVNGYSDVLVEHCQRSQAGLTYCCEEQFMCALWRLTTDAALRNEMGSRGNRYVAERFSADVVTAKLHRVIRGVGERRQPSSAGNAPRGFPPVAFRVSGLSATTPLQ